MAEKEKDTVEELIEDVSITIRPEFSSNPLRGVSSPSELIRNMKEKFSCVYVTFTKRF